MSAPARLADYPIHLGLGASAVPQPRFTGAMEWYEAYGARHGDDGDSDGKGGRLVSMHSFAEPWTTWEMHPHGDEVVVCVAGEITLIQEHDGQSGTIRLTAGEYAINPPGVWHTADVSGPATALFITAGLGTAVRPR